MRQSICGLVVGLLFGIGLAMSSMTDPAVVTGFLDLAGAWNPTMAFVMAGAVTVSLLGYRLVMRRGRPLCAEKFDVRDRNRIDRPLLAGAAIFGVGWGLTGYCPGPAIASITSGNAGVYVFLAAMVVGMLAVRLIGAVRSAPRQPIEMEG